VWYFLLFVLVVAIGVFIWDYRRKAARREAVSKERFQELVKAGVSQGPRAAAPAVPAPAAAAATGQGAASPEAAPDEAPAIAYSARAHLLGQAEKLIYYLLRTGLPDLEVFPKVPLAAVIDAPGKGYDHEHQLRRLSRQLIDFVVCDKEMRVVAAVQIAAAGPDAVVAQRIRAECLTSAGVRLVTIEPGALPKRSELRAFIYGSAAGSGAAAAPHRPV
jgi:hypothetical protein